MSGIAHKGLRSATRVGLFAATGVVFLLAWRGVELWRGAAEPDLISTIVVGALAGLAALAACAARDAAARRAARAEARYRGVVDASSDFVFVLDEEGRTIHASPGSERITGCLPEEFLRNPRLLRAIIHPDDRALFDLQLAGARAGRRPPRVELRLTRGAESSRLIALEAAPIVTADGQRLGCRGSMRDISEREREREELRRTTRLESAARLAGGVAHDFNNLMQSVLGNADMLLEDEADPLRRSMLEEIGEAARRAGELSDQLLAFARGGRYHNVPCDLSRIASDALSQLEAERPEHVSFECHFGEHVPFVKGDPAQLRAVVVHLVRNAIESYDREGHVRVRTAARRSLDGVELASLIVEDQGCGMTRAVLSRAYEPFFTTKLRGRGLGLAAVYGIARNHGGDVLIESEPGVGTEVRVDLPVLVAPVEGAGAALSPAPPAGVGARVLVVDDDPRVLEVMHDALVRFGYDAVAARDGESALAIARDATQRVDAVLLDLVMPGLSGRELFPLLREARPGAPIVLASGYESGEVARELIRGGASGFLTKPFGISELAAAMERALVGSRRGP